MRRRPLLQAGLACPAIVRAEAATTLRFIP